MQRFGFRNAVLKTESTTNQMTGEGVGGAGVDVEAEDAPRSLDDVDEPAEVREVSAKEQVVRPARTNAMRMRAI